MDKKGGEGREGGSTTKYCTCNTYLGTEGDSGTLNDGGGTGPETKTWRSESFSKDTYINNENSLLINIISVYFDFISTRFSI